jgi:DNA polymerase-1
MDTTIENSVDDLSNNPILIIDAMNLFVRSYCAFPSVSSHGYQMGGFVGFIKTLTKLSNDLMPKAIIITWEGGGSSKRRKIYADYKMNRRPEKLNRFYEDDIPDSNENRLHQNIALVKFLRLMPVWQLYTEDCEGDDLIAYLVSGPLYHKNIIIGSSDKDMHQLLTDKIHQYSFHKKIVLSPQNIYEEYGILAENFGIAKAICGDTSDNIPGVSRIGFKTLTKHIPLFREKSIILDDVIKYAAANRDSSMPCQRIIDEVDKIKMNWDLVKLDINSIPVSKSNQINTLLSTSRQAMDLIGMHKLLNDEGVSNINVDQLTFAFTRYQSCKII